ncbi:hypothetical protein HGT71_04730 [Rosenbergiella epipactidis]|uniref:hypothetical protein n=1 Tax=Rosenbergiella epipactidis TaxID=1544694 RepID=UPI001BD992DA|nr:hypothetical protein [Rosenbergiella epipactidis]MBT0717581.1 hypothetical protein [Rosenbergiella epipactidis]
MVFFSSKGNTANRGSRHNGADPEDRFMIVGQVMTNAGESEAERYLLQICYAVTPYAL